jgi:hypothetical protein
MARRYLFADEAGNFDFSLRSGATKYFILGTVALADPAIGEQLLTLRRELAWQGVGLEACFHAAEDTQVIRDAVFDVLEAADFRADFTIFEKRKTVPARQQEEPFYKLAWFEHFKFVGPIVVKRQDELLVIVASIGTKKRRRAIRLGVEDVVLQIVPGNTWEVAFWPCDSDPCLQIADYCTWAVQRKWERGDSRSYDRIKAKVRSEHDYFQWGNVYHY